MRWANNSNHDNVCKAAPTTTTKMYDARNIGNINLRLSPVLSARLPEAEKNKLISYHIWISA